jgi:RNA polymerase sigma-70 factor (ECF subfamily)
MNAMLAFRPVPAARQEAAVDGVEAERGLLARVRSGDRAAAEQLVEQSYPLVFASLVRLCGGDRDAAADLTQDTFRKAWESFGRFDGRSRFTTWLYRIAYNTFLNRIRTPIRAVEFEPDRHEIADPGRPVDVELVRAQQVRSVRKAVLLLPDPLRFAVSARYWGELEVVEIARIEGISRVGVQKRLKRALTLMERMLAEVSR